MKIAKGNRKKIEKIWNFMLLKFEDIDGKVKS